MKHTLIVLLALMALVVNAQPDLRELSPILTLSHVQVLSSSEAQQWALVTCGENPQVLAYGESALSADALAPQFRWLVEQANEQAVLSSQTSAQRAPRRADYKDIPTLLTCHWAQDDPFNRLTPVFPGYTTHTKTGCVAVAMAQVLYYHKLPTRLHGKKTYTYTSSEGLRGSDGSTTITISDDLSRYSIDWANLIDRPWNRNTGRADCTEAEAMAVSTLMYVCGLATKMNYGYKGSGAHVDWATEGINTLFDGLRAEHVSFDEGVILSELSARRPVIYSGGGHCFVIDGANAQGYLHCNLGWGGGGEVDEQGNQGNPDGYYLPTVMAGYTSGKSIVRVWQDGTATPWQPGTDGGSGTPTGVALAVTSGTLQPGETLQLNPYVLPVTLSGSYTFSFTSSNPQVATVSSTGLIRALSAGTATITCRLGSYLSVDFSLVVRAAASGSLEGTVLTDLTHLTEPVTVTISNPASEAFLVADEASSHDLTVRGLSPGESTSYADYYKPASPTSLGSYWQIEKVDPSAPSDHRYYVTNLASHLYLHFASGVYSLTEEPTPLYVEAKTGSVFTINWGTGLSTTGYKDYLALQTSSPTPAGCGGNSVGNYRLWRIQQVEAPSVITSCPSLVLSEEGEKLDAGKKILDADYDVLGRREFSLDAGYGIRLHRGQKILLR